MYIDIRGIEDELLQISIYDLSGNIVMNDQITSHSISKIDTRELAPGVYIGSILSKGMKIARFKFVKSD